MNDEYIDHRKPRHKSRGGVGALPESFERRQCEATTISLIGLAISAASATASIQGQRYQAQAQEQQQAELTKANNFVAGEQMAQTRLQEAQQAEAAARENEKARLAAQKARSTAVVTAGEAGVSGASVDALLGEYGMQLGQFREASNRQTQLTASASASQIAAIQTGARFQNLSINAPIVGPNYGAEAVKFAGSAMSTYQAYNPDAFKRPKK